MKKVMFMTNSLYGGGAEKVLQTIINNLDSEKYEITLYSMHREPIDKNIYTKDFNYKVVFDEYRGKSALLKKIYRFISKVKVKIFNTFSSKMFYRLFFHDKYDVEVAFIEGESTKIVSGSTNKKSLKYAWVHIDLEQNHWTSFLYSNVEDEKKHYLVFDRIICVSDSVREAFLRKFIIKENRVVTKYNPVDREEIIKKSLEPQNFRDCDKKFRLISVGRLVEQKGYDRLVRIAYRLKCAGISFELLILGEGKERNKLEEYIKKNKLEDTVFLLGFQDNPYNFMRSSDLFVCSSRTEGFSTVVTEAVVLGLPVISTQCAGINELFGDYKCGVIVNNGENSLYEAVYSVLSNPERLSDYRKASLVRGKDFILSRSITEIEYLLDM